MDKIDDLVGAAQRTEVCVANLPGFRPAKQVRSQQKADRIVASAAHLLQQKSFSSISVQEIGQLADCAVTAIYARFTDKEALLPAIQLIILERNRFAEHAQFRVKNYNSKSLIEFCHDFVKMIYTFFQKNRFFFEAAVRSGNLFLFDQYSNYILEQRNLLNPIVSMLMDVSSDEASGPLELAICAVSSICRDKVVSFGGFRSMDLDSLSQIFMMILQRNIADFRAEPA